MGTLLKLCFQVSLRLNSHNSALSLDLPVPNPNHCYGVKSIKILQELSHWDCDTKVFPFQYLLNKNHFFLQRASSISHTLTSWREKSSTPFWIYHHNTCSLSKLTEDPKQTILNGPPITLQFCVAFQHARHIPNSLTHNQMVNTQGRTPTDFKNKQTNKSELPVFSVWLSCSI